MARIIGNTTATPNPQADWAQTDATKADYIKNKPVIPKTLIFDTKENLNNLINESPDGKNLLNPWNYDKEKIRTRGYIRDDGGIELECNSYDEETGDFYGNCYVYNLKLDAGTYTLRINCYSAIYEGDCKTSALFYINGTRSDLSFSTDEERSCFTKTFKLSEISNIELQLECDVQASSNTCWVQLEKGSTPTEYETFIPFGIHEYGAAKQDLNVGDLLLIQEEKTPDYYWNGSEIVEIEAKGSIDDVTVDLSNYYTKEEINGLIMNGSQIQIITWGADD